MNFINLYRIILGKARIRIWTFNLLDYYIGRVKIRKEFLWFQRNLAVFNADRVWTNTRLFIFFVFTEIIIKKNGHFGDWQNSEQNYSPV